MSSGDKGAGGQVSRCKDAKGSVGQRKVDKTPGRGCLNRHKNDEKLSQFGRKKNAKLQTLPIQRSNVVYRPMRKKNSVIMSYGNYWFFKCIWVAIAYRGAILAQNISRNSSSAR